VNGKGLSSGGNAEGKTVGKRDQVGGGHDTNFHKESQDKIRGDLGQIGRKPRRAGEGTGKRKRKKSKKREVRNGDLRATWG